jgi:preprotein translocase subunit Sss1
MKNKFMRRYSYHEGLMIAIAATPVIAIVGIIGYLIWRVI